ncbi:uridine kinase family protein [Streptomyces sp. 4.24]|uniref:uridine kinase family protein n=1 Tax=Streptomyces tritrimontium TaxID=3406573 RepID=UPI003BB7EE6C
MEFQAASRSLPALAHELAGLPASLGAVRLIGIDGHAGSGKSTFAGALAEALGGAPVLHLDDVASHEELFAWDDRLRSQVLEPLAAGRPAHWAPYDWVERRFGAERLLEPAPVLLVEGVGAGRRALRPRLARLLWMETPRAQSWGRGRNRDGRELSDFWDGWERAELAHFSDDPSRPFADILVRQSGTGYEWSSETAATAGTTTSVTEGDGLPRA